MEKTTLIMHCDCKKNQMMLGVLLVLLGLCMPAFLKENRFHILELLSLSINKQDSGQLLQCAFFLVALNCIRALPHYLGAFLIAESLEIYYEGKKMLFIKGFFCFLLIILVYYLIEFIYSIKYDFGPGAVSIILSIVFLERMDFYFTNLFKKFMFLTFFLLGMQWMDIMPCLTAYHVGRGDISVGIKLVAEFLECGQLLNFFSLTFFCTFLLIALIFFKLTYEEHRKNISIQQNEIAKRKLTDTRFKALELRSFAEIQNLVHDLKTPLTSIQGLATLSHMMVPDTKVQQYMRNISDSVDTMNGMISEIIHEENKNIIKTSELFSLVLAHPGLDNIVGINYENTCPDCKLSANKIRLARAVINILENAMHAVPSQSGTIDIVVKQDNDFVDIRITDNGIGISAEELPKIWDAGYSTSASTGLGLGFVKSVIENHNGFIGITSVKDKYTCVTIRLCVAELL